MIPGTAELGGKAPVLVFDDVDVDEAVAGALFAAFMMTGPHMCMMWNRFQLIAGAPETTPS